MSAPPPPPPAAPTASATDAKPKSKWQVAIAEPPAWKDVYPFHCAAQLGSAASLQSQLDAGARAQLDSRDDDGWAPLHYAAWYGHTAAVRVLLAAGAAVNVTNVGGATPLHFAAGAGHVETVHTLLDAGADRTIKSAEKQTPAELTQQLQPDNAARVLEMLSS